MDKYPWDKDWHELTDAQRAQARIQAPMPIENVGYYYWYVIGGCVSYMLKKEHREAYDNHTLFGKLD